MAMMSHLVLVSAGVWIIELYLNRMMFVCVLFSFFWVVLG